MSGPKMQPLITAATYGTMFGPRVDVTQRVVDLLERVPLPLPINNYALGIDPANNQVKTFLVVYQYPGGEPQTDIIVEGDFWQPKQRVSAQPKPPLTIQRVAVIYAYAPTDEYGDRNTQFFLKQGVTACQGVDYYLVSNGKCRVDTSCAPITVWERTNTGFDFGAWNYALEDQGLADQPYDAYIFINNSVAGPVLPTYAQGLIHWTQLFVGHLTERVKRVGCTTNYFLGRHIQSYAFAVDRVGLDLLRRANIFSSATNYTDKSEVILKCEVSSSRVLEDAGYEEVSFELCRSAGGYSNQTSHIIYQATTGLQFPLFEHLFIKTRFNLPTINEALERFFGW